MPKGIPAKKVIKEPQYVTREEVAQMLEDYLASFTVSAPEKRASIQRVEEFNGEVEPEPLDNLKMAYEDKLASARNAIAILPPNLIKDGRHARENVQAICGFLIDEEFMDDLYKDFTHE
jgi:hypothetical protein